MYCLQQRVGLFSHSLSLLLTPPCALLDGTMANLAFLLHTLPKDRTSFLFLFHYSHCFILPSGFPISPWNLFFKGSSASLWDLLVFSNYILINTDSHNDLLFIYWFLLFLPYFFRTCLFTDASFSPFHTIPSHR